MAAIHVEYLMRFQRSMRREIMNIYESNSNFSRYHNLETENSCLFILWALSI